MDNGTTLPIIDKKSQEQKQLYPEAYQIADDDRYRNGEPREIYLAENVGIADKGIGCAVKAVCEVLPGNNAGKVEKERREAVCWKMGYHPEDYGEYNSGKKWLYDVPERPQDSLFVN
jgi:hypothetical protein